MVMNTSHMLVSIMRIEYHEIFSVILMLYGELKLL
jgi:hypothetical protein